MTDQEFEAIVGWLAKLPKPVTGSRNESWMTAGQLLANLRAEFGPRLSSGSEQELDDDLCARYREREDCQIRPAFYPREDTCQRFWGYTKNVEPGPERTKLLEMLQKKPRPLEPELLGPGAPIVFVSHALHDHHFAARVRLNLMRHGVRCWLAEGDMKEGEGLIETIQAALSRSDALIILVSSLSISSAWVLTEAETALKLGKNVVALIDASDAPACEFIREFISVREKTLRREYNKYWPGTEECRRLSDKMKERFERVESSKRRVEKFDLSLGLMCTALSLPCREIAFYPDVPNGWKDESLKGFDSALDYLKRSSSPSVGLDSNDSPPAFGS